MKVIIDRSKWLRGEGDEESYLLRKEDGKMCCLGFCALAAGYTPEQILGKRTIDGLIREEADNKSLPAELRFLVSEISDGYGGRTRHYASRIGENLMEDNDVKTDDRARVVRDDDWREETITKKLRQFDIDVEFVDGEGPASGR